MSIQQRIASDVYRMAEKAVTPEQIKSIQAHLVKSVQTGAVPSYVGVPLLSDLNQKMARIQAAPAQAQAMVQQPPIAQQVMGQAGQGVEALPSGLPAEGMAGGGIVAFAGGGEAMSPSQIAEYLLSDEDDEDVDYVNAILGDIQNQEPRSAADEGDEDGVMATTARESFSMKEGNEAPRGVTRERTSVTGPAGLESLLKMIEQKESGGRDYDKYGRLLTSPAGAQGRMQVMPGTSRDPGFGIRPAKEGDVEDLARVGREYYTKMLDRYQDPKIAAIAYNWGPANTDKWLSSGADMSRLPTETRNYVANMREGGIARFQNTGLVDFANMTPEEIKETMRRRIKMEGARDAFSRTPAAAPAAPAAPAAAQPSFMEAAKNALSRIRPGVGGLGVGLPALFHSGELNANEEQELARRRAMAPTIGIPSGPASVSKPLPPATGGADHGPVGGPSLEESKRAAFEQAIGATQDAEDMDAGLNALPTPEAKEPSKEAAPKEEGGIRELLNKYREDLRDQRETDKYLSLLSAGLGMMGGTSPFAGANIGQGALQGVKTYQQAAQLRGADERSLLSGELGLKKYEQLGDIRKAALERQKLVDIENQQIKRDRLLQGQQKMYAEQLNEIRRLAQTQALAEYKGTLLPEQKELIMAQAETKLLQDPAYNSLYEKVYGFKPSRTGGGGAMSSERASQFKVER